MKIAEASPFKGKPIINAATIFGASTGKELIYRIPVTGKRPVKISVEGLKQGLVFEDGIIRGTVTEEGSFDVKIIAENEEGIAEKTVNFEIAEDNSLLTPLMGFTSWNAFGDTVMQEDMETTAKIMVENGIADYGYDYVNLDSGWQEDYGGKYNAVVPNHKFKDMKKMCDTIHSMGMKCGIYSTPMLYAWGSIYGEKTNSGCTRGEPDILYTNANNGIGTERLEKNNAMQWEEWGFDYLKYDWDPTDPINADYMKKELLKLNRDMAFCVTVYASRFYGKYWRKYCNSWRNNADSADNWENVKARLNTVDGWGEFVTVGHFYDLDMLEIGHMNTNGGIRGLSENEAVFAYTLRAFFMSPIQLSCKLSELTKFEYNLFCNEEIIAINQDALAQYPILVYESGDAKLYRRTLENGDTAWAFFNAGDEPVKGIIGLEKQMKIRNLWLKEDMPADKCIRFEAEPHTAYVYRTC